ncbi:MAG: NAD(P)(+) transhydrogenase (Re/Si-specific) subunit beta [Rubricoccaceae bacterium]|nr:NAD(P)(+) transhydrogenase (Re/Si-specific) subunit beta [Rubricoccaceae bacterium]
MIHDLITLAYLIAAALFIFGLKRLSSPRTARRGNQMAAVGMLIAVVAALFEEQILNPVELIAGLALGGAIGLLLARRTKMTSMPELVAAFNGFGGAASALVAAAEVMRYAAGEAGPDYTSTLSLTIALSVLIGSVTFSGSFVAFAKLNGRLKSMGFPGLRFVSILIALGVLGAGGLMIEQAAVFPAEAEMMTNALFALAGLALVLGIFLVLPIGGADMPVVVALLNSYSGLAAAATGFVLQNYALIVSGALVGASGLILTKIMCDAMNRSLINVLLGGFGAEAAKSSVGSGDEEERPIRQTSPDDAAVLMSYAGSVIIVPGYGLAVAQAQHEVREMADLLQKEGVEVRYAIHPVAGRMPGHMTVLLAEANVPYDLLVEMDDINTDFPSTDVVLVVGANDVVNPAARTDESSPIYGMPILNVDEAENVIVLKRSMNTGYAGVQNELFFNPKTSMLFGDAKDSVGGIISELKELQTA